MTRIYREISLWPSNPRATCRLDTSDLTAWCGHETIWVQAAQEQRVLVTADLDFPLHGAKPSGMVLVRGFGRISTATLAVLLVDTVRSLGDGLLDRLVVVAPGRVRVRAL